MNRYLFALENHSTLSDGINPKSESHQTKFKKYLRKFLETPGTSWKNRKLLHPPVHFNINL